MLEVIGSGIGLVALTVLIHAVGTALLIRLVARYFAQADGQLTGRSALPAIVATAVGLTILHVIEILVWALAYQWLAPLELLDTLEQAAYFSFVTFTTVGYGDVVLDSDHWRILAGIEALNGIVLVGWSTALLFAVVQRSWHALGKG